MAEVATAKRPGENVRVEAVPAPHGRCKVKVSDVPFSESRAEPLNRGYESAAGHSQTPDSGVVVSPLDQRFAAAVQPLSAVNPDLRLQPGPSGPGYSIAQTPTMSTIVIIRNDASLPRPGGVQPAPTSTPSPSTPGRDDRPAPFTVSPNVVQPVAGTGTATSHQPVCAPPAATSKFVVTDTTTPAAPAGGPGYRAVPSPSNDDRTMMRLNSGETERRRYVVTVGTLTAMERAEAMAFPAAVDANRAVSESVELRSNDVSSTGPSRQRNDVQLDDGSRQAVVPALVRMRTPADRLITPSKPKDPTTVAKQCDAKATAVAKQRQAKRAPAKGKGQPGQRSKQSQVVAKQSENRSHAPAKVSRGVSKRKDRNSQQTSEKDAEPVKRSVAELRALFQGQRA